MSRFVIKDKEGKEQQDVWALLDLLESAHLVLWTDMMRKGAKFRAVTFGLLNAWVIAMQIQTLGCTLRGCQVLGNHSIVHAFTNVLLLFLQVLLLKMTSSSGLSSGWRRLSGAWSVS